MALKEEQNLLEKRELAKQKRQDEAAKQLEEQQAASDANPKGMLAP